MLFDPAPLDNTAPEPAVSLQARFLLRLIRDYSKKHGYCWMLEETIAQQMGRTVRSVQRYVRELSGAGLIDVQRKAHRGRTRNYYQLVILPEETHQEPANTTRMSGRDTTRMSGDEATNTTRMSGRDPTRMSGHIDTTQVLTQDEILNSNSKAKTAAVAAENPDSRTAEKSKALQALVDEKVFPDVAADLVAAKPLTLIQAALRYYRAKKWHGPQALVGMIKTPLKFGFFEAHDGWQAPRADSSPGTSRVRSGFDYDAAARLRAEAERAARLEREQSGQSLSSGNESRPGQAAPPESARPSLAEAAAALVGGFAKSTKPPLIEARKYPLSQEEIRARCAKGLPPLPEAEERRPAADEPRIIQLRQRDTG